MKYKDYMKKRAGVFGSAASVGRSIGAYGGWWLSCALLGMAGTGYAAGWALAKMTAHSPEDIATAQKEYDNERKKSDIGYLHGQLSQEFEDNRSHTKPKAARVIN